MLFSTTFLFDLTQSFYKDYSKAVRYFQKGHYDEAVPLLLSAIQIEPKSAKAYALLLWSYEKLGKKEEAKDVMEKVLLLNPDDLSIREQLADVYYGLSDYETAESLYRDILDKEPKKNIKKKLAEVLVWQKKYDEAIPVLEELTKAEPKNLELAELVADVYAWSKKYDKAIESYRALLVANYHADDVTLKLADALRLSGRNDEAIKIYSEYLNKGK